LLNFHPNGLAVNNSDEKTVVEDRRAANINTLVPWPTKLSVTLRLKFFLAGVAFPVVCLAAILLGASPSISSPWQSGELEDFVLILVATPTILVFFPLLLYSFVCLTIWCYRPVVSRQFVIRLGLFTGA